LNGIPAPVFFNDGDSFRVLGGRLQGGKARLGGFNTLETPGPVHQWGKWTAKELYINAKQATLNGRRGKWSCTSDMSTDTYGRTLWICPELAADQIRKGLAHAMSVTEEPANAKLIEVQAEAIRERRGMWAHGVPEYILTSIHSADEDIQGRGTYNRLVSTKDGSSLKWRHDDNYSECDVICDEGVDTRPRTDAAIDVLRADPSTEAILASSSKYKDGKHMTLLVNDFLRGRGVAKRVAKAEHAAPIEAVLARLKADGSLGRKLDTPSCMVHVVFERRYGGGKASCLKL
jgi:endonuclease YncB( thermonuclease family)